MAYSDQDHAKALEIYRTTGRNMEATVRRSGVSKPTLYKWKKAGLPEAVTGGADWDTHLDEREREHVLEVRATAVEEERDFLDEQRTRTRRMLDRIYTAVMDGGVELKAADYDKILRNYLLLDGQEQDKKDFMHSFAARLLGICADVVTEQQFAVLQSRFTTTIHDETKKLGIIPRQH